MTTNINNNFKSTLQQLGRTAFHGALTGGKSQVSLIKNSALLALAAGIGIAALTIGTNLAGGTDPRGAAGVLNTLGNEAINGIDEAAKKTSHFIENVLTPVQMLGNNERLSSIVSPLIKTFLAINVATYIIRQAQVPTTITITDTSDTAANASDPMSTGSTVVKTFSRSTLLKACQLLSKGALIGAALAIVREVAPQKLQSHFITQRILERVTEFCAENYIEKFFK